MRILYKTVWRQKIVWIPFSAFLIIAAVISQISSFMLLSWREQNLEISTSYKLNFTIKSTVQPDTFYIKKSEVPLMFSSSLVSSQYTPTRIFSYIEQPVTKVEWGAEAAGAYKRSDTENMVIMQTIKDIESVSEFISGQLFIQEISQNVYEGQIPIYISNRLAAANQWEIDDIITIEVPGIQSIPYECQIYAIFYNTDDVAWMASDYNGEIIDNTIFVGWSYLYPQYTEQEFDQLDDFITTETIFTLKDPQSYENFLNELILDEFTSDKIEILLLDDSYFSMMDSLDELHNTSRFMYILCAAVLMLLFVYLLLIYTKKKINEFDILCGLGFSYIDLYKLILQQFSLYSFIGLIFASLISLVCGFIFFTTLLRQIIIVLAISCVLIQLVVILYSFVITSLILKLIKHGL